MSNHQPSNVSKFAAALRGLLDDTGTFSRDQWAEVLGVSTAAISQWVNDHTIPRANILRNILDIVRKHCGEAHSVLQRFQELSQEPSDRVSPHGSRMGPSVGNYVVTPVLEGFHRTLQTIPPDKQEQVLFRAAADCRRLRISSPEKRLPVQVPNRLYFHDASAFGIAGQIDGPIGQTTASDDLVVRRREDSCSESAEVKIHSVKFTSPAKKLGLYVSYSCKNHRPEGKQWFEFRRFARTYWQILSNYILLVSDVTAMSLREVARDLKRDGAEPRWDIEVARNHRALATRLIATNKEEVERILLFLDPERLSDELENLWILQQSAAENGQKLYINWGVHLWAERESKMRLGIRDKSLIGNDDAIVLVGHGSGPPVDRFVLKGLEKVMLFPWVILTGGPLATISDICKSRESTAAQTNQTSDAMLDSASAFVENYLNTSGSQASDKLCHVIACQGRNQMMGKAMQDFIRVCANPRMHVNLMLNKETVEEWIQQPFEYLDPQTVLQ